MRKVFWYRASVRFKPGKRAHLTRVPITLAVTVNKQNIVWIAAQSASDSELLNYIKKESVLKKFIRRLIKALKGSKTLAPQIVLTFLLTTGNTYIWNRDRTSNDRTSKDWTSKDLFPTRLLTSEDECKWFWHQMIYFPGTINTMSTCYIIALQ